MTALLKLANFSAIRLSAEPQHDLHFQLACDFSDHLEWLVGVSEGILPGDPYDDYLRTQEALEFIKLWHLLMEKVAKRQMASADATSQQLYDAVCVVHDGSFGGSDIAEREALNAIAEITRYFATNRPQINSFELRCLILKVKLPLEHYIDTFA